MKTAISIIVLIATVYLLAMAVLYFFQRSLLFQAVTETENVGREEVSFNNNGVQLRGWVLNPGQKRAVIYFGGNSEVITNNIDRFEQVFNQYTVYLINYRGYGESQGTPSEAGLFSDAIAIYDQIQQQYQSISLLGRSLGSGVATYLASQRTIERLILLTPYDSIAEVAQAHYPYLPTRYLIKDRFESIDYAAGIKVPVLIVTAENDQVVPVEHALKLKEYFTNTEVRYEMISTAAHNNVTEFSRYHAILGEFINVVD